MFVVVYNWMIANVVFGDAKSAVTLQKTTLAFVVISPSRNLFVLSAD